MVEPKQVMDLAQFRAACAYIDFDAEAAETLRRFLPLATEAFDPIVADFYDAILAHPSSRVALRGGQAQVERLKRTLKTWLSSGLMGPHGQEFLDARRRIGQVHVNIQLPQELMFTAMNRVRRALLSHAARTLQGSELEKTSTAIEQWLDLELAIMLDSYREHWATRMRVAERLATMGQFAAAIGHELRNPLGVIQSSMSLIAQRLERLDVEDALVTKQQQRIARQIKECGDTIDGLLQLARETPPTKVRTRLAEVVALAVDTVDVPASIQVHVDVDEGQFVHGDVVQLREVLSNLVQNAVQALKAGGSITLSAKETQGGAELWVTDDGPGVPESLRHRIFDIWFSTRPEGTGLGLALARKLAEGHGGTLTLEPSASGARFRVWIPG